MITSETGKALFLFSKTGCTISAEATKRSQIVYDFADHCTLALSFLARLKVCWVIEGHRSMQEN